MKLVWNNHYPV